MTPDRNSLAYTLRDYQRHTVDANRAAHLGQRRPTGTGRQLRTGNVLATGLGKTVISSEMIRQAARERRERSLVLVDRLPLIQQHKDKIHSMLPGASIGIVQGSDYNDWQADVVIASVPTLGQMSGHRLAQIPANWFGLGIADECHHSAADTWQRVIHNFSMPWAGFTATMGRGDDRALGDTWPEIVAEFDIGYGIRNRHLVKPEGKRIRVKNLMLDEVKRSRGDLQDEDLGAAMEDADAGNTIAKAYLEHTPGKRMGLYCPTKSSARKWADDCIAAGIPTEVIVAETTAEERAGIFERFRLGTTLIISSVGTLTEGWDAPWCEGIIMARPTASKNLYIQILGRALRTWAPLGKIGGQVGAILLDVVGVSERMSLISLTDLFPEVRDGSLYPDEPKPEPELEAKEPSGPGEDLTKDFIDGELVAFEIDLFDESESAWLQTEPSRTYGAEGQGIWFIPTSIAYFYLWPKGDGTFGLGRKAIAAPRGHGQVLEKSLTLEGGMAWAERYAAEEDPSISLRKAAWRKSKPSERMLKLAAGLGIEVFPHTRQGELSDKITRRKASQSLPTPK